MGVILHPEGTSPVRCTAVEHLKMMCMLYEVMADELCWGPPFESHREFSGTPFFLSQSKTKKKHTPCTLPAQTKTSLPRRFHPSSFGRH